MYFASPLNGRSLWNWVSALRVKKLERWSYRGPTKKFDVILIRVDTIQQCDRRTDGQTDRDRHIASRGKTHFDSSRTKHVIIFSLDSPVLIATRVTSGDNRRQMHIAQTLVCFLLCHIQYQRFRAKTDYAICISESHRERSNTRVPAGTTQHVCGHSSRIKI